MALLGLAKPLLHLVGLAKKSGISQHTQKIRSKQIKEINIKKYKIFVSSLQDKSEKTDRSEFPKMKSTYITPSKTSAGDRSAAITDDQYQGIKR